MLSNREVKSAVSLAIKKYARTQANYFYLKNHLYEKFDSEDVEFFEGLIDAISNLGEHSFELRDKFFSQPNYLDFYNSLIDSDKREEVREFCLKEHEKIKSSTERMIVNSILQLLADKLEELYD